MRVLWIALMVAVPVLDASQTPSPLPLAQQVWVMQDSGTTAGLRGIDSVDGKVAWASGTGGTVLKTVDGGAHWIKCTVPDAAKDGATLDFRGVQAWDAETAIVMASGKGKLSRLYKTKDGCKAWKLIFKNIDREGFWDAIYFTENRNWEQGWLLGDPVRGRFTILYTPNFGQRWFQLKNREFRVKQGTQGIFAASNSSMFSPVPGSVVAKIGTGGAGGAFVYSSSEAYIRLDDCSDEDLASDEGKRKWVRQPVPVGRRTDTSGVFSIAGRPEEPDLLGYPPQTKAFIAVGGDYTKPGESAGTAAWFADGGEQWTASTTPPHGYRSTVQWSESLKLWITAGTNGSDFSRDDGKTWQPLDNGNWNALSLPFVVGPNGRIARLNSTALPGVK